MRRGVGGGGESNQSFPRVLSTILLEGTGDSYMEKAPKGGMIGRGGSKY